MLLMAEDPIFRYIAIEKSWYHADGAWEQVLLALTDLKALWSISHPGRSHQNGDRLKPDGANLPLAIVCSKLARNQ